MTSYINAELNNQIVKSMMINNNCNHVSGDDTNENGFKLMAKEDEECDCNVVRNLRTDNTIGIRLNSQTNSLFIYDRKEALKSVISGGILTLFMDTRRSTSTIWINFNSVRFRPPGSNEAVNLRTVTNWTRLTDFVRVWGDFGTGVVESRVGQLVGEGYGFNNNWAAYITEDPKFMANDSANKNIIFTLSRDIDIINKSNDTYLLFYRDDTDENNRFIMWVPTNTKIPYRLPTFEGAPLTTRITYNADTGEMTGVPAVPPVPEVETINYSSLQTISGGDTVTYANTNQFSWVRWNQFIVVSHISSNIGANRLIKIGMPTEDANVVNITVNGDRVFSIVRLLGFEVGTNSKALFYITTSNTFILVDQGAPKNAYNPDSSWILICFINPLDRSLAWLPGRINLPFMSNSSSNYNNITGEASWLNRNSTASQNILKIDDITKGRKVIDIALKDNNISFDSTALVNTLNSQSARLSKSPKQIGARIKFNCAILSQWGNQIISDKNIVKSRDGCFDIKFPTALSNATFGVNVSMQSNKPGIIQYSNLTEKGISVLTFDLQGNLCQFDGDFTIEIQA